MKKQRILLIITLAWIFLFLVFAAYKIIHAPVFCWDSVKTDPVTGEDTMIGGCSPQYGMAVVEMVLPSAVWMVILVTLIAAYLISRRSAKKHS